MNSEQLERMHGDKGFIAALDQSGGSTPKALAQYGVPESSYKNEEEMYAMVHAMRSRIMTSPAFTGEHILGVILFENTMNRMVEGEPTADYLWNTVCAMLPAFHYPYHPLQNFAMVVPYRGNCSEGGGGMARREQQ